MIRSHFRSVFTKLHLIVFLTFMFQENSYDSLDIFDHTWCMVRMSLVEHFPLLSAWSSSWLLNLTRLPVHILVYCSANELTLKRSNDHNIWNFICLHQKDEKTFGGYHFNINDQVNVVKAIPGGNLIVQGVNLNTSKFPFVDVYMGEVTCFW